MLSLSITRGVPHFSPVLGEVGISHSSPLSREVGVFRSLCAVFLGVLLFLGAGDDSARVSRLGHQVICMCGCNQILLECNHLGCPYLSRMRPELVAAVDRGDSDDAILHAFVLNYGALVLAAPPNKGFGRVAWLMPYLALAIGVAVVLFVVGAWKNRPLVAPASVPTAIRGGELDRFREQARKETAE